MSDSNSPDIRSFVKYDKYSHFPIQNLPFGIFCSDKQSKKRVGVAIGDKVLDIAACYKHKMIDHHKLCESSLNNDYLNDFMSIDSDHLREIRDSISILLRDDNPKLRDDLEMISKVLIPVSDVTVSMPVKVSNYTDFYSSKEHAVNLGSLFRDKDNPLPPNWLHMPIAYDGRSGSISISGCDVNRPKGQIIENNNSQPVLSHTKSLDMELEIGTFIGKNSTRGAHVSTKNTRDYVFGMTLLNDWSARDIQKWEYQPLGPFLGKNFFTSISPWVVTIDALEPFKSKQVEQYPKVLPYLSRNENYHFDINLEVSLKSSVMNEYQIITKTNYNKLYWDISQQISHHSINGCPMHVGDLLASGTISGSDKGSYGSLIEITKGGKNPLILEDGSTRSYLQDGDSVLMTGYCQGDGYRVGFGNLVSQIV